ncbi:hypothetical protein [Staphylococcus shinii]|uniref:hypothetical protein n=1 Tax=Staphylococcus shinii TaxID=2912228 RepID=UPI00298EEC80|nr:hypothetical protein [Staphylococcus shinii]MDW8572539.1 hypothetical protein [Staphylococcus shinii]
MTRTVRLNLLNLFLLIVLMLALTINIFEGFYLFGHDTTNNNVNNWNLCINSNIKKQNSD